MGRQRQKTPLNRKRAPFGNDNRRLRQQTLQALIIERRRHNQQLEIVAQPLLYVEQQRQRQIRLQAALVKLIEDRQPHAAQLRIALDHPRQNAFRHHFEARVRPDAGLRAHAIAHGLAGLLSQQFRQPLRHVTRGQPPRLQQDYASVDVTFGEDLQRQPGGFPGAGWRIKQNLRRMPQGRKKFREDGGNRQ